MWVFRSLLFFHPARWFYEVFLWVLILNLEFQEVAFDPWLMSILSFFPMIMFFILGFFLTLINAFMKKVVWWKSCVFKGRFNAYLYQFKRFILKNVFLFLFIFFWPLINAITKFPEKISARRERAINLRKGRLTPD